MANAVILMKGCSFVVDPPEVRLDGVPNHDVEEGKDTVVLRCTADANPPASIIWQRLGSREISSISETLTFRPVNQRDSGTYTCLGKNAIGSSQPVSTTLDIKCKLSLFCTQKFRCKSGSVMNF